MTEYESVALEKVLNDFRHKLGSLVGDCLAQMPASLEDHTLQCLREIEIYQIDGIDYEKHLPVKRTNWGTEPKAELPDFLKI